MLTKRIRTLLVFAFVVLGAGGAAPAHAPAATAQQTAPRDSLMVVNANLEEAWNLADVRDRSDIDRFVRRVLDEFHYKPDVLTLQEVRRSSARYVAGKLSRRTGQAYKVVVMPPVDPYFPYGGGRAGAKETTIVINKATMQVLHGGGYKATVAKRAHVVERHDPVFHQAYALLRKRGSSMKFATMSIHFLPPAYLATENLDTYYRNRWAKQMNAFLRKKYGGRDGLRYLLGGDFNHPSCERGSRGTCYEHSPFWLSLRDRGYEDTAKRNGPIDYIFTKGLATAIAGRDSGYDRLPKAKRYADRAFRWAVLGPDRYAPTRPRPLHLDLRERTSRPRGEPLIELRWTKADDRSGSGVAGYELFRRLGDAPSWAEVPESEWFGPHSYFDRDLGWGDTVHYRVRARDVAGNVSGFLTRTVEVSKANVGEM